MKPKEIMEECKGCASFGQLGSSPYCKAEVESKISLGYTCPCMICLVKGVCNTICEEFEDYNNICNKERNGRADYNNICNEEIDGK